jgi:hypothetical protein
VLLFLHSSTSRKVTPFVGLVSCMTQRELQKLVRDEILSYLRAAAPASRIYRCIPPNALLQHFNSWHGGVDAAGFAQNIFNPVLARLQAAGTVGSWILQPGIICLFA